MLDLLYTEALKKKSSINLIVDEIFDKKLDIESVWNSKKITSDESNFILAAGDGSFNKKKFIGFNFYAVGAETLVYTPKDKTSKIKTIETVEVDIMPHQYFIDDRLRNMMAIFEIKTAMKSFDEYDIDFYMDDGSILGNLIRPIPIDKNIPIAQKTKILRKISEKMNDNISSIELKEEFRDMLENEENDKNAFLTFLENLEHLIALKYLLNNKEKIIAVSKTSTSNDIFHGNVPDIAIFDRFTKEEGYSKPYYKKVTNEVKHDFPIEDNFFKNLWFTIFFVRLENNKNVIKIELPYYAKDDEIENIISILKSNATDGYPFLLKKAHNDVVIKNKDITSLSQIIEFIDKSGREMLD